MSGRAVIALEPDHLRAGKILLKAQDVVDIGAAPAVDRLIIIADAADVTASLGQELQPKILDRVRILVFVDQDIAEAPLVIGEHIGVLAEQPHAFEQEVAKIGGVQTLQPLLIKRISRPPLPLAKASASALGTRVGSR